MLHKNKLRIMALFFEEPARNFQLREISRLTGIAPTSVKKYLKELVAEQLILRSTETLYPSYVADEASRMFRVYKQVDMVLRICLSGLTDYLARTTLPDCIVLFGSARSGEYAKNSDVDVFVQSSEQKLDMHSFEKKIGHKINVLFEADIHSLSKELFNNIVNGLVLYGFLRARR